jgi:trigger factor
LKDFETQLGGTSAGETKSFDLRFPDDYQSKEVAGKTAQFEVSVKDVGAPHLPEVDAEFAKSLGVVDGDIAKMRAEVKANLEREVRVRLKARAKDQVMKVLLDATTIEAPKGLVQIEVERMQAAARQDLAQRGLKMTEDTPLSGEIFEQAARRRVNLGLILGELVKAHNLQARPEQVRTLIEEQAQSYERPEEVVKWYYGSPERLREIESVAAEENVVEWAFGAAKAHDQQIDFNELMGNK